MMHQILQAIHNDFENDSKQFKTQTYNSPFEHHSSQLTIKETVITDQHSIDCLQQSLFTNNNSSGNSNRFGDESENITLKAIVVLYVCPKKSKHIKHQMDISPFDFLNHLSRIKLVLNRFQNRYIKLFSQTQHSNHGNSGNNNSSDDNQSAKECVSRSLNHCEPYMEYLYSKNYTEFLSNTAAKFGEDLFVTTPSTLYMSIHFKYRLVLLPKYFLLDRKRAGNNGKMYVDLDAYVYEKFCHSHTLLCDLQTVQPYLPPNITKNYIKSLMDAMYKIYAFVHKININELTVRPNFMLDDMSNRRENQYSRIWNQFLFNIHPSMIFINKQTNWCSTVQLFVQFFRIAAVCTHTDTHRDTTTNANANTNTNTNPNPQHRRGGYTEEEMQHLSFAVNVCRAGGEGDCYGYTDHQKYVAPEFLAHFDPNPNSKKHKQRLQQKKSKSLLKKPAVSLSLSMHSEPRHDIKMDFGALQSDLLRQTQTHTHTQKNVQKKLKLKPSRKLPPKPPNSKTTVSDSDLSETDDESLLSVLSSVTRSEPHPQQKKMDTFSFNSSRVKLVIDEEEEDDDEAIADAYLRMHLPVSSTTPLSVKTSTANIENDHQNEKTDDTEDFVASLLSGIGGALPAAPNKLTLNDDHHNRAKQTEQTNLSLNQNRNRNRSPNPNPITTTATATATATAPKKAPQKKSFTPKFETNVSSLWAKAMKKESHKKPVSHTPTIKTLKAKTDPFANDIMDIIDIIDIIDIADHNRNRNTNVNDLFQVSQPLVLGLSHIEKSNLRMRTDVKYLPALWNLSSNLFSIGVILFLLLNGYAPMETAAISDRWYQAIVKKKFYKFWKLHRASPVLGINKVVSELPADFNTTTMHLYSKRNIFPDGPNLTTRASDGRDAHFDFPDLDAKENRMDSPNLTARDRRAHTPTPMSLPNKRNKNNNGNVPASLTPGLPKQISSSYNVLHENRNTVPQQYRQWVFDCKCVQGLINDLLTFNSHQRLNAFFQYNADDLDFGDNLQPLYHKYWWLDIGYVESYDCIFDFHSISVVSNADSIDAHELQLMKELNLMRSKRQASNRKTGKLVYAESLEVNMRHFGPLPSSPKLAVENQPPLYPFAARIEGLSLCGCGELYTTLEWGKFMYHVTQIVVNKCVGSVHSVPDAGEGRQRLICSLQFGGNNNRVDFQIEIWRSVKYTQQLRSGHYVYIVQWRRLYGNILDYHKVINKVIHEQCAGLFDLSKPIRKLLKVKASKGK